LPFLNEAYFDLNLEKAGLFVLASNDLDLSPEEMLKKYKDQDKVEKGFRSDIPQMSPKIKIIFY